MQAAQTSLLQFLGGPKQFVIPVYQRSYSWTEQQLDKLWKDVLAAGADSRKKSHFLGSVVYIEDTINFVTDQSNLVIDGQQRLTTMLLLIEAIARKVGNDGPTVDISDDRLRAYYLLNMHDSGDRRYKMRLSKTDDASLRSVLDRAPVPGKSSKRVEANFGWFMDRVSQERENIAMLWRGIKKLSIIQVKLERLIDDPQAIFESMNSTGLDLSQADLIRNFVLMGLEPTEQTTLYDRYWHAMEEEFGQHNVWRFDRFVRHFLSIRSGKLEREDDIYEGFKTYASREGCPTVEALCADLLSFARCYCRFVLDREDDPELADAFRDLQQLGGEVSHGFLLALYRDYNDGILSRSELLSAVRLVETFLFRRAVTWSRVGPGSLTPSRSQIRT